MITVTARIKVLLPYTCAVCKRSQLGTTRRVEFEGYSLNDLKKFIDAIELRSADMPIEWRFSDKFICPDC